VSKVLVQHSCRSDTKPLALQHHPVGIVLNLELYHDGTDVAEYGEVRVEQEMVVERNNVLRKTEVAPRE
jgi:hypothetical protein